MRNKLSLILLLIAVVVSFVYLSWRHFPQNSDFECRARMHAKMIDNACNKDSVVDIFISVRKDGKGYILASGTHSCPHTEMKTIKGIVNFTYHQEGSYYSIHMSDRPPGMIEILNGLKNENIKVKATEMNNNNYIISSPIETFLMCTKD